MPTTLDPDPLDFKTKEMTKEVKMGKDSQIRLTKIDEDGYVKDRV